jgi:uncharacterized protein (TIGR01777 family)
MKVAISGATGFIGKELIAQLDASGNEYVLISRDADRARKMFPRATSVLQWDLPSMPLGSEGSEGSEGLVGLEGLDGVIHMAGAPVAKRWTAAHKRAIEDSRVRYTRALVEALRGVRERPPVLVSFSAIGYYGAHDDIRLNEASAPGTDFLAGVCRDWEAEAGKAVDLGIRVVNPRIGIVVGRGGGALAQMLLPFKLGLGGPIGNGRQWMSWIHVSDVVGLILEALGNPAISGPINLTAPDPVTNREFSKVLGRVLRRPAILPIPVLGLKAMFGGFADILATGQRVIPEKAIASGYHYRFTNLREALADAV